MKIKHCLILSAGLGTRMGSIGKKLPKVLWPVFEKSLLELQVSYAKKLGAENIYVNVHHLHESIVEYVKANNLDVTVIYEEELLDVGGAVYNLASRPEVSYDGSLLILNGDQFLMFNDSIIQRALSECLRVGIALLAIRVGADSGYNETVINDGLLIGINRAPDKSSDYETYSGMALVDLSQLEKRVGAQSFFKSVADFNAKDVAMLDAGEYEYWDFGTIDRYWNSSYCLLESRTSQFYNFCLENQAIVESRNFGSSYQSNLGINLSNYEMTSDRKFIVMESKYHNELKEEGIYWNDLFIAVKQSS